MNTKAEQDLAVGALADQDLALHRQVVADGKVRKAKLLKVPGTSIVLPYQEYKNAGGRYFMLFYYAGGRRIRECRTSWQKLKARAEVIATAIQNGQAQQALFSEADRAELLAAREAAPGKNLVLIASEHTAGEKLLAGRNVSISEAVRGYIQQHPIDLISRDVPEIITEFFTKRKIGTKWRRVLGKMLERFGEKFPKRTLPSLTTRELDDWLDGIAGARTLRTRRNYRNAIESLFNFARGRGYVAKDWNLLEGIDDPEPRPAQVNLYTPDELVRLLNKAETYKAGRKLVPLIAITAFAGVRHGEMNEEKLEHLDWADFDWDAKMIYVGRAAAKTGRERTVDMPDNLIAWLQTHRRPRGKVVPLVNTSSALCRLRKKAGITGPKRNALRKSFITYKLALTRSIDLVADQAGNSASIIRKNYNKPDTRRREAAERWFAISPTRADILPLFQWANGAAGRQ